MTTSNANQFIGSKISLISKSEIRYEGILYSLDLQDATISLAKVKSFGTEDRPTERPVPCKEEIYEFIIFRGSDIKGIDVLEPPKATATLTGGLPNDPAIVEVSHSHYQSGQAPPPVVPPQANAGYSSGPSVSGGYPGFGGAAILGTTKSAQQGNSELHSSGVEQPSGISVPLDSTGSTHDTSRSNASTPSFLSNRKSPTIDAGIQVTNEDRSRNNRQLSSNRQGEGRGSRSTSQDRRRQNRTQGADRQTGYQPRGRGNFVNNRGGFRGRGGRRGFGNQGFIQAQQPPKVTFEDPFDFEKANEELQEAFAKLKLRPEDLEKKEGEQDGVEGSNPENEEQENKQPPETYYSKDSFFDKISCEATEKGKGRPSRVDWKAERQLNAETFGLPLNNGQRRGYQRGGYRGNFRGYGGPPRGTYGRGGYGGYNAGYGYGNSGGYYQYNNRYNGGRGGNRGYRQQQQQNQQQQQQQKQPQKPQQTVAQ